MNTCMAEVADHREIGSPKNQISTFEKVTHIKFIFEILKRDYN